MMSASALVTLQANPLCYMELNKEKMLPKVKKFTSHWDNKVAETGSLSLQGDTWAKDDGFTFQKG